jgi:uncharacterized protein DUF5677
MWLCPACRNTPERNTLTFGLEAEWEHFSQRHPRFIARLPELKRIIEQVVARRLDKSTLADRVIFYLGRLAVEDFNEVILSVGNGYGVAGIKLLRSMYERVVTMMFLIRHPERTKDFLDYDRVHTRKAINHLKTSGVDVATHFTPEFLANVESRYQAVKDRFIEVLCAACGKTRPSLSWTATDLASMAKQVNFAANFPTLAYLPTLQIHTTAHAIMTRLEHVEGGGTAFKPEPQRSLADVALAGAHLCLTVMLQEHIKHFNLSSMEVERLLPIFQECLEEYKQELVEV